MFVKGTLTILIIVFLVVIACSYYTNKEGFDDISNSYFNAISNDLSSAVNTVSADASSAANAVSSDVSSASQAITGDGTQGQATGTVAISTQGVDNSVPAPAPGPTGVPMLPCQSGASSTPQRTDVVPQVSISGSSYDAMTLQQRSDLLKDIQKVVRNEIVASRQTTPIISGQTRLMPDSDATAQGKEFENSCYKDTEYRCPKNPDGSCPPIPDMTQYIKKDAIPCWGCSLDY